MSKAVEVLGFVTPGHLARVISGEGLQTSAEEAVRTLPQGFPYREQIRTAQQEGAGDTLIRAACLAAQETLHSEVGEYRRLNQTVC